MNADVPRGAASVQVLLANAGHGRHSTTLAAIVPLIECPQPVTESLPACVSFLSPSRTPNSPSLLLQTLTILPEVNFPNRVGVFPYAPSGPRVSLGTGLRVCGPCTTLSGV